MRSYLSTSKFFQKMKKKQHIQLVLDNLQDYTDDDIDALPNMQQWIKDELKELRYEWIDKLHFMMNEAIAIGLTPEMITNYYVAKNKHNVERQNRIGGY